MNGLKRSDSEHLKEVLYQGLKRELRTMALYQCNTISDYDIFKMELRTMALYQCNTISDYDIFKMELRTMAVYQCNTISDYNIFKIELRMLESGLKEATLERKPCKPVVKTEPKKEEMSELTDYLGS